MNNFNISVVVPTFKSERVIARCLESILAQHNAGIQIIIVDGASPDNTLKVVQSLNVPDIIIISEPDKGIYDAINKGISVAQGAMIGVLGSDDTYDHQALSFVKKHLQDGFGIIAGLTEIDGNLRADEPYGKASLISGIPFGHNAMFASKETYNKVGLYDKSYRICGDAQWVHRAIKENIKCLKIDELFVRFGTEGVSSTNPEEIMAETYRTIQENFPFLSQDETKNIFYAYRKWGGQETIPSIFEKYKSNINFVETLSEAFAAIQKFEGETRLDSKRIKSNLRQLLGKLGFKG